MDIQVDTNAAEVSRFVRRLWASQVPFATAKAINKTATEFQSAQREAMEGRFTLRRESWAKRSIKINRHDFATKEKPEAIVRVETPGDPSRSDILTQHEDGGTKRPRGRSLAVPQDEARRTGKGVLRKDERPRALFEGAGSSVFKKKGRNVHSRRGGMEVLKGKKRTIMIRRPDGTGVILRRQGRGKGSRLSLLYIFTTEADLDKRLRFEDTARAIVPKAFPDHFAREFARAIRTAR